MRTGVPMWWARGLEPHSGRRPTPLSLRSKDLRGRTALDLTDVNRRDDSLWRGPYGPAILMTFATTDAS